jgi:lipopolysaccharide export LptBFGC system permease protein LptF
METVQPELALRASSLLLIVLLGLTLIALSLVSMWKERRHGQPIKGIVWFALAIVGFYAVIALLGGYAQKARSLDRVTHRVEAVSFGLE